MVFLKAGSSEVVAFLQIMGLHWFSLSMVSMQCLVDMFEGIDVWEFIISLN